MAKTILINMASVRRLEFKKNLIFGHLTVTEYQICICTKFHHSRMVFITRQHTS